MVSDEFMKVYTREKGCFTLSSGRTSDHYYNLKNAFCRNPPIVLGYFISCVWCQFDSIISAELGGALIASGLAAYFKKPLCILRKDGTCISKPFGRVLIIDDVKTTGATLTKLREKVLSSNARIAQEIIGVDRSQESDNMKGLRIIDLERKLTEAIQNDDDSLTQELEDTILRKEKKK